MDKIRIRRKVKKHIRSKGKNCDFEVTPTFIKFWWHVLNKAVFDEELDPPYNVQIRNFRDDSAGWCLPTKNGEVLGFLREYDDRFQFLTVLVHEMVHQYENQYYGKMSHGRTFYDWEETIKRRVGLPLGEYVD